MEKFLSLSPDNEPKRAIISKAESEDIQSLTNNSVIYKEISLPSPPRNDEFSSPPSISTVDSPSTYASISPPGAIVTVEAKDISIVSNRYDEPSLTPQNVSTYPVVYTVCNVNEFQESTKANSDHCNNLLKNFVEQDDVICQIDKSTQEVKDEVVNCVLSFTEEREVYDLDDCQSFYVIHVKTSITETDITIKKEQLDTLYSLLKKKFPEINFNADCGKAKELFKQYIAERYVRDKETMKTTRVNKYPGWGKIFEAKRFHPGQDENGGTLLTLPSINKNDRYNLYGYGLKLLELAPLGVVLPLFLHAHSGFVRKLFQEGSHPIQYVPTLIAPTGSRKTSLSKIFFLLFNHETYASFNDTDRAIELVSTHYKDQTVIFDDCKLTNDKTLLTKFEKFIRPLSESQGRAKSSDAGSRLERTQQMHTAIITAESYPNELQQSSKLRLLPIFMTQKDVNNEVLSYFQDERALAKQRSEVAKLDEYMMLFIHYIEQHYDEIVLMVQKSSPVYDISQHARLNSMYQIQSLLAKIILNFGVWCNYYSQEQANIIHQQWCNTIKGVVLENDSLCNDATPTTLFLRTLANGEAANEIVYAPDKATYWANPELYVGIIYRSDLILIPSPAYAYVERTCQRLGRRMEYTMDTIANRLRDEGISTGYSGSDRKKPRPYTKLSKGNKKMDVICIPLSNYSKLTMEED
jgi:hypothetical protein